MQQRAAIRLKRRHPHSRLLVLINPARHGSLNQTFIHYDKHPTEALRLIHTASPQIP